MRNTIFLDISKYELRKQSNFQNWNFSSPKILFGLNETIEINVQKSFFAAYRYQTLTHDHPHLLVHGTYLQKHEDRLIIWQKLCGHPI